MHETFAGFILRPDSTGAFSRRNAKYFACFFWIASNQVEIIFSSSRNSKPISTQENFPRKENFVQFDWLTQIFRRKKILKLKNFNF
jgi:hypothetical protein